MTKAYMNWSGGKDSSLCLHRVLQDKKYSVDTLLTSINATYDRISMHGVRRELLVAQANALGIPLTTIELPEQPSMQEYETTLLQKVNTLRSEQYTHALFGDIFLEDLKRYREQQLQQVGITAVFPLWQVSTKQLMQEFLAAGFKAIIVCVNEQFLDKSFCGRLIDESFVRDLPAHVDVCGENGEYHSYVFDGPVFKQPIPCTKGELVYRRYDAPLSNSPNGNTCQPSQYGFYFCDLLPGA
ncbi:MAG: diphthine--ammonia ligase [Chitinophagaceae bacterium]